MAEAKEKKCPICDKTADVKFYPFCCKRCADVDLGRWFGEAYVIPTNETPDEGTMTEEEG